MKPYVICHMCTTIDGRILSNRWGTLPGRRNAASLFETTASSFGIGAWIVGTTTMREFAARSRAAKRAKRRVPREDHVADAGAKSFAIGTDTHGVLRFEKGAVDGDHVVLLLTERASNDHLAQLQDAGVSYLLCGKAEVDLRVALDKLWRRFGIRKLMLEGGGTFNGAMLHAGLVDEISQIIVPVIDGGRGVQTFFDIPGDAPRRAAASLRLKKHTTLPGGIQWLRYTVVRARR